MSDTKVLFFGRKACKNSAAIAEHLKIKLDNVESCFFENRYDRVPNDLDNWKGSYVFSFRCPVKIPMHILKSASSAAINFHPAPPNYRGSGSTNWAIYDGAKEFGSTAHIMENEIDSGQILECRRFKIKDNETLPELWDRTNKNTFSLAIDFIDGISKSGNSFIEDKKKEAESEFWSGKLRKISEVDQLQSLTTNLSKGDVDKIIRATSIDGFEPFITLWGYKFIYKKV